MHSSILDKLVSTNESSTINARFDGSDNNELGVANQFRTAKSKNVVWLKDPETRFLTLGAKLDFVELSKLLLKL